MWEFCITIQGRQHCFPLPRLVEKFHLPSIGPVNFPELELATAVLELSKAVETIAPKSKLTQQLSEITSQFIGQVQKGLPEGVQLHQGKVTTEHAAA